MAEKELIAIVGSGRPFSLRLPENETAEQALLALTGRSGGAQPQPMWRAEWLETEEGFYIRRDAIVAYVAGHKEGEWAVAG